MNDDAVAYLEQGYDRWELVERPSVRVQRHELVQSVKINGATRSRENDGPIYGLKDDHECSNYCAGRGPAMSIMNWFPARESLEGAHP